MKGAGEEVLDRVTRGILGTVFDLEEEPGSVEETATKYVDDLKDAYFNEYEGQSGEGQAGVASWEDRINGYFSGRSGQFVGVLQGVDAGEVYQRALAAAGLKRFKIKGNR